MGRIGRPILFIPPNPLDQSCWLLQMAHLSTSYRCLAVDVPGPGRSPKAIPGLTMDDLARACWEVLDGAIGAEPAILVGCSVGANIIPHMYRQQPERTLAIVLTGAGYNPGREFAARRIRQYSERGVAFRREHALEDFSPSFRETPLAQYIADLVAERNASADLDSIIHQFRALAEPYPDGIHDIRCPALIITGSEDSSHERAFELQKRIPGCELKVIAGAGHACFLEQPWLFDRYVLEFLDAHGLFPRPIVEAE